MKTVAKSRSKFNVKFLFSFLFVMTTGLSGLQAQTAEITIQTSAQCQECKEKIEKALLAQKGVRMADLDVKTKMVKVAYNSKKVDADKLRKVIASVGYDADDVQADPEAVKKLSPCCTREGHKH